MNKKYNIELSHPIRDMMGEVVFGLENFEVLEESKHKVIASRRISGNLGKKEKSAWDNGLKQRFFTLFSKLQKKIGIINFRIYLGSKNAQVIFANGGFLITNRPYFTYIEKATQIYGYTAKNYNRVLSKLLLQFLLSRKNLKNIFFLTEAAYKGMLNIPFYNKKIKNLIREKGVVIYPPIKNLGKPRIERFKEIKEKISFLYIASSLYGKGGPEMINAFAHFYKENKNIRLVLVINIESIKSADLKRIEEHGGIELHDYIFSREELFDKFYNRCHILCYPTYSDSFSAVINEAISAYMPIITSDFYSIPERVVDGYNGFLFPATFPNYDKNYVIYQEHFTDRTDLMDTVNVYQKDGKLKYAEDFLYEKMKILVHDRALLYRMASNSKKMYEEKLDPEKIRNKVNILLLKGIKKIKEK